MLNWLLLAKWRLAFISSRCSHLAQMSSMLHAQWCFQLDGILFIPLVSLLSARSLFCSSQYSKFEMSYKSVCFHQYGFNVHFSIHHWHFERNRCPVGVTTQDPELQESLHVPVSCFSLSFVRQYKHIVADKSWTSGKLSQCNDQICVAIDRRCRCVWSITALSWTHCSSIECVHGEKLCARISGCASWLFDWRFGRRADVSARCVVGSRWRSVGRIDWESYWVTSHSLVHLKQICQICLPWILENKLIFLKFWNENTQINVPVYIHTCYCRMDAKWSWKDWSCCRIRRHRIDAARKLFFCIFTIIESRLFGK